jgi:glutathione S-transferase
VRCYPAERGRSVHGPGYGSLTVPLRLHYLPGTAAMAPHAALAEIGAPYELVRVERDADGRSSAAYLALNPAGRIPTLQDGGLVLTESAAILLHLADRFPVAGLAPEVGTDERAELYRRLFNLTNTLQPTLMRLLYPERFGDSGVRAIAEAEAHEQFDRLDGDLATRRWLAGDRRSVADLFLFMVTRWGRRLEPAAWDRPHLRAHFLRTLELPGVSRMIDEQGLELPPFAA